MNIVKNNNHEIIMNLLFYSSSNPGVCVFASRDATKWISGHRPAICCALGFHHINPNLAFTPHYHSHSVEINHFHTSTLPC